MEYQIEVWIKSNSGRIYSFVTPAPYPTEDDAINVMNDLKLDNKDLNFRVIPDLNRK